MISFDLTREQRRIVEKLGTWSERKYYLDHWRLMPRATSDLTGRSRHYWQNITSYVLPFPRNTVD